MCGCFNVIFFLCSDLDIIIYDDDKLSRDEFVGKIVITENNLKTYVENTERYGEMIFKLRDISNEESKRLSKSTLAVQFVRVEPWEIEIKELEGSLLTVFPGDDPEIIVKEFVKGYEGKKLTTKETKHIVKMIRRYMKSQGA